MVRLFIAIVIISFCFASCETDLATVKKVSSLKAAEVETGNGIEILYSTDAKVRVKLDAPEMIKSNTSAASYIEYDKGLVVYFYDDSLNQTSKLTADYGRINEKDNQMLVRDNVVVVNSKNETLNCEELTWNNATRKIYSDKFVKIQTGDEIIYGDGLEANEDLTNYKIKKIKGTINLKNGPVE